MKTILMYALLLLLLLIVPIAVSTASLYTGYDAHMDFKKDEIIIKYLARISESFNMEIEKKLTDIKTIVKNFDHNQLTKATSLKIVPQAFVLNDGVFVGASTEELKNYFDKRNHIDSVIQDTGRRGFFFSYFGLNRYVFVVPADEEQRRFYVFLIDATEILDRIIGRKIFSNFSVIYVNSSSEILIPTKYMDIDTKRLILIEKDSETFSKLKDPGITDTWTYDKKDTQIRFFGVQSKSIFLSEGKFVGVLFQKERLKSFLNEYKVLFYEFGFLIPLIFLLVVVILVKVNRKSKMMLQKLDENVKSIQENPFDTENTFQMHEYDEFREPIMSILNEVRFQKLQINTFDEVGFVMLNIFDINTLLKAVIKSIEKILSATRTSIVLINEKDGSFYIKMASGFMDETKDCNNMPVKGGGKIIDYLIQRGESLLVEDINSDPRFSDYQGGQSYRSSSFIASPIMANRRIIGVISVTDKESGERFSKEDLSVLNIFTRYIGTAFSNYRMYKKKLFENVEIKKVEFLKEIYSALYSTEFNKMISGNGISVRHHIEVTKQFGGDFFDFIKVDDDKYVLIMSDTSGSGFGSIMNIAFFKSIVYANLIGNKDLQFKKLFEKINEDLIKIIPQTTFFTAFAALFDMTRKKIDYINFGFPTPLIINRGVDGKKQKILKGGNLMLGIFNDANIEVHSEEFTSDDILIIYSDGIVKNLNYLQEKYPIMEMNDGLLNEIDKESDVEKYSQFIFDDIKTFYGYKELEDDISLAVVKFD
ncbi:SpoIIE family protein phosphatase [bacterium]|nr:SpoIIE family protein phosphatase [bacterium]